MLVGWHAAACRDHNARRPTRVGLLKRSQSTTSYGRVHGSSQTEDRKREGSQKYARTLKTMLVEIRFHRLL